MVSKHLILRGGVLSLLILIYIVISLYFSTGFFFRSSNYEPIKLYFTESGASEVPVGIIIDNENQSSLAVGQKYPVTSIEIWIKNPFESSWSEFNIRCENFRQQYNFWEPTGEGSEEAYNITKAREYEMTHIPEFILFAPFIKNGYVPIWLEVWYSQPSISVITNNFFKRVSYDKWEAKYTIDDRYVDGKIDSTTLFPITSQEKLQKIVLKVSIPPRYKIENPDKDLSIQGSSEVGYIITKELTLGNSIDLVISNPKNKKTKDLIQVVATVFTISADLILEYILRKRR
jgi:hypothetical protein